VQTDSDSNSLTPPQRILSFMEIAQLRRPAAASAYLLLIIVSPF